MNYYAHSVEGAPEEQWQTLADHAKGVAQKVAEFSASFCHPNYAQNLGLLHDVGKYQQAFQKRLHGDPTPVEHAICGAQLWMEHEIHEAGAYCIAGHHGGLPDGGTIADKNTTLLGRLKGQTQDFSDYAKELTLFPSVDDPYLEAVVAEGEAGDKEYAFWTRMMFSCLTDGDYLDTEQVYAPATLRHIPMDFPTCLAKIQAKLDGFSQEGTVNVARNRLRQQMMQATETDSQIHLLNLPTGAGKTLASMEFALSRAIKGKKKRIIYVIPYTSIIEQNAAVFREVLGEGILEHHCNFDYEKIGDDSLRTKLQYAAENWDADIIVTTNVQFFQSVYGNKSREVRKLHNIADSILIFDEVHMLPAHFYAPCLEAIQILTARYGCEALLMTATMPDFSRWFKEFGLQNESMHHLISDTTPFSAFKRCTIENLGVLSMEGLISHISPEKSTLIVVNTRKTAKILYQKLTGKKFHLSTYMNHHDRKRVIAEIRACLGKEPITVVSTSLIEAGVDLDFDQVFRELAGLDNLLQTAGRCDREGKKGGCVTYSFAFKEAEFQIAKGDIVLKRNCTQEIFEQYADFQSIEAITAYFNRFYGMVKPNMTRYDFGKAMTWQIDPKYDGLLSISFRTYKESFQLIDDNSTTVVMPCAESKQLLQALTPENARAIKRKLQRFGVNVRQWEHNQLQEQGVLSEIMGVEYLTNPNYYDAETGLRFEDETIYMV